MRGIAQGLIVIGLLVAANVVAAGVVLVLGRSLLAIDASWTAPWPWLLIGALGAGAAYLFLKGTMLFVAERAASAQRRLCVANENPNKGLESASGRRGG
jgi:hypothetical protein